MRRQDLKRRHVDRAIPASLQYEPPIPTTTDFAIDAVLPNALGTRMACSRGLFVGMRRRFNRACSITANVGNNSRIDPQDPGAER